ncbi:transporter substrate-binding domain-containing protein [Pimelobacter simplex]|uniref:Putative amino acid ABC transporter, periplasmic amino acid-binding protein n=1 Tax=Nocardioides simplex TaxID=2045 RepID=A0A0A1DT03_NOCSI|nr:ABC transporter substrate-binding protein [Pimelobacter simplex]AIY18515.1 putative amino acid ABC transporter, periplasmic amino acid-binding protein [Pimelobacter simplex]MCG8153333.1 transporter substrate-binding domain-containing protein [Pimelobacter simplex]GEB14135.1 amino acid ABC transporter substrate-binding protein [Pimelobacter simplex]SFM33299.1 amino acid ABC transporter substrate-binding protein, PAAT family [Pimelobacter simplex]
MRVNRLLTPLAAALLVSALAACAPAEDKAEQTGKTADADKCAVADLPLVTKGVLSVGTDSPAYEPWFVDNDPSNGKGYESAVAYAIAEQLGFTEDQVTWVTVPFNNSYKPGPKNFDFDINQISIDPEREKAVDFSNGYYSAAQAVIVLKDSPAAKITDIADLADFKIGAQTGTTSLTAIRDVIKPAKDPLVFQNTNNAKQAMLNGQVDAIIADLPTAFYISSVEIPDSKLLGQFQFDSGTPEEFGLLFEQGNELLPCVNGALDALEKDGTLAELQKKWLSDVVSVPELK